MVDNDKIGFQIRVLTHCDFRSNVLIGQSYSLVVLNQLISEKQR